MPWRGRAFFRAFRPALPPFFFLVLLARPTMKSCCQPGTPPTPSPWRRWVTYLLYALAAAFVAFVAGQQFGG